MKHFSYILNSSDTLNGLLASTELWIEASQAKSILVQIYVPEMTDCWFQKLAASIDKSFPKAVVVGASTVGEISNGQTLTGTSVIGFTFFYSTIVTAIAIPCINRDEISVGKELSHAIDALHQHIAAMLLLATPLSINVSSLLKGLKKKRFDFPVFGGGAAAYNKTNRSFVFTESVCYDQGIIAVVFSGTELHVNVQSCLGWRALSKEMTITDSDGLTIKTIDNQPAFNMYAHYLNIQNDDSFFLNVMEFPLLLKREHHLTARVPINSNTKGDIQFLADVHKGEKFRLGFGNPHSIVREADIIQHTMRQFAPEAIFLYTCGCRRFLLQNNIDLETTPFESIAPTFGFYTYGEFFGTSNNIKLLNATLCAIGLREGPQRLCPIKNHNLYPLSVDLIDPYANRYASLVANLIHFIGAVTHELEQSNRELAHLSSTDKLTQIPNRVKLDKILAKELEYAKRYMTEFSIVLMDIDHFKEVNDTYGHLTGDAVLVNLAAILTHNIRTADIAGRWGGEEFLLILQKISDEEAYLVAEKLRSIIADEDLPVSGHITCSFGIASYHSGDTSATLLSRADNALYEAKSAGRNRVVISKFG